MARWRIGVNDFADILRRLRQSRALSQEELAARAMMSAKAVGALGRGERLAPYPRTIRALADALDLDDDERNELVSAVQRGNSAARATAGDPPPSRSDPDAWLAPATPIVGRERDIEQVVSLVRSPDRRLVTLTGPGGVGKPGFR